MPLKLSPVAEHQINEIVYALNCTRSEAISHALESQRAFEMITDDQIFNYLDTHYNEALKNWQNVNKNSLSQIPSN